MVAKSILEENPTLTEAQAYIEAFMRCSPEEREMIRRE
jgi:hypothetical protein